MNKTTIDKNPSFQRLIELALAAVFIVIILFNMMIVHDDEVAVITRLGKSHKVIQNPGIYFKIPFIDASNTISKKISETYVQPIQSNTKDRRELYIEAYAIWQLNDPVLFIYTNSGKQPSAIIDGYLSAAIPSSATNFTYMEIKSPLDDTYNLETVLKKKIEEKAVQNGITIKDVFIKSLYLSSKSEKTVVDRMKIESEKLVEAIIAEGESESGKIKQAGDREASLITKKADFQVNTSRAAADSEAAKLYAKSYGKDLEFYNFTKALELYKKNLKDKTTIIFPANSPFAKYLMK